MFIIFYVKIYTSARHVLYEVNILSTCLSWCLKRWLTETSTVLVSEKRHSIPRTGKQRHRDKPMFLNQHRLAVHTIEIHRGTEWACIPGVYEMELKSGVLSVLLSFSSLYWSWIRVTASLWPFWNPTEHRSVPLHFLLNLPIFIMLFFMLFFNMSMYSIYKDIFFCCFRKKRQVLCDWIYIKQQASG